MQTAYPACKAAVCEPDFCGCGMKSADFVCESGGKELQCADLWCESGGMENENAIVLT